MVQDTYRESVPRRDRWIKIAMGKVTIAAGAMLALVTTLGFSDSAAETLATPDSLPSDLVASFPDPARLEAEVQALEGDAFARHPPERAVVCVGSSSMRFWHGALATDLAPFRAVPRGFGGSTFYDAWFHFDRLILPLRPSAVVLYEGDNDIDFGVPPETVVATFDALVSRIHDAFPECHIFVLSIKPSLARWHEWSEVVRTNQLLSEACDAAGLLHYLDVATPMLNDEGTPRRELFLPDGLHMNESGYAVWRKVVRPALLRHVPQLAD